MKTENIDGVIKSFDNERDFINYVQLVWDENETDENEANIEKPFDFHAALSYLILYTEIKIIW